jgi:hypothetical protein
MGLLYKTIERAFFVKRFGKRSVVGIRSLSTPPSLLLVFPIA